MECPSCQTDNRPGADYCSRCGAELASASPPEAGPARASQSPSGDVLASSGQRSAKTNGLAIVSLVLAVVSGPLLFACSGIGLLCGIGALVSGLIARRQVENSGGAQKGKGLALAGVIIGGLLGVLPGLALSTIQGLALLGPAIGNVFENIVNSI